MAITKLPTPLNTPPTPNKRTRFQIKRSMSTTQSTAFRNVRTFVVTARGTCRLCSVSTAYSALLDLFGAVLDGTESAFWFWFGVFCGAYGG
eukprot:CAMPEP_0196154732 /NCGR_PEP_ID=MMETSP0910-20130528/39426_1 /TAXON_ID=49265 /ORGANISM="Thalassiosira rotula, Strain GSO102" /LENGTH=90 /DNA_ID=CAMNT_0041418805 /DNA_START=43 /DNA_END=312 /DNA_ORIENTATION=+